MYNNPFFDFPYYRNYYSRNYYNRKPISTDSKYNQNNVNLHTSQENVKKNTTSMDSSSTLDDSKDYDNRNCKSDSQAYINILGIELYSDDILILCILLSLYLEGVKDEMLFICLILILLT